MAIKCPKCKRVYPLALFDSQQGVLCACGELLGLEHENVFDQIHEICKQYELKLEEEKVAQIRKMADNIVALILNVEKKRDEVELEKSRLKVLISEISPDRTHLYELIYKPRFERLWKKFRETDSD